MESEAGVEVGVVDVLAPHDPAPVVEALAAPAVEVVVHAGEQDVGLLRRQWGAEVTNILDTQIAAAFAGSSIQTSYGKLVRELLGVSLRKAAGFTSWDDRPLSPAQLSYVRQDVEHLPALARALEDRLQAERRLDLAREESRRLERASIERDPERDFRRLQGLGDLRPGERTVARELVLWRDEAARAADRPPRSVVLDVSLTQLAREQPTSVDQLRRVRGIDRVPRRHDRDVLAAIERGSEAPPIHLERVEQAPDEADPLISLGEALTRARAQEHRIAPQLIATRADIAEVVVAQLLDREEPVIPLLEGWRRELVGAELLELLRGERILSVGRDGRLRARATGTD